jgi:hypothetical protein
MMDLVQAHAELDDPTEIAIWIRQDDREAWLVEVIPTMNPDEHPERPVAFTPERSRRSLKTSRHMATPEQVKAWIRQAEADLTAANVEAPGLAECHRRYWLQQSATGDDFRARHGALE